MVDPDPSEPAIREAHIPDTVSLSDTHSITTSQYDVMIQDELERTWILNLSMHFRDKSKREKFFVTYRDKETSWRRVTISLDYRNAPENSLEMDLAHTKLQREKSAKIYEAIRESLQDIQFYDSVTNLKLQTTDGRLHVHVVEDTNEIIHYPTVRQVQHLGCRRIRERDIDFDSHMSGFVYKVRVGGEVLIKKEIPGPDTIDEFLYEINALNRLGYSRNVISFFGVVVDDQDENVKGLLISYADQGALIDLIYDNRQDSELGTPWPIRERWAKQIVEGLSDIHESGFVQGDFTLSNIVIDDEGDAKIIDINRRGCPVGWEPPEATPLIESGQRISMYIGVKSDLYQLGMVLWALATQEDEPEAHGRPLLLEPDVIVPDWYRELVDICLSDDPRDRLQASSLLRLFPEPAMRHDSENDLPSISVDDGYSRQEYFVRDENGHSHITTAAPSDWSYVNRGQAAGYSQDPYFYTRGRSPPSPLPSHSGQFDAFHRGSQVSAWAGARNIAPSYSDVGADEIQRGRSVTPRTSKDSLAGGSSMGQQDSITPDATYRGNLDAIVNSSPSHDLTYRPDGLVAKDQDELDAAVTPTPNTPVKEEVDLISNDLKHSDASEETQVKALDLAVKDLDPQEHAHPGDNCLQARKPAETHEEAETEPERQQVHQAEDTRTGADVHESSTHGPSVLNQPDTTDVQPGVLDNLNHAEVDHEAGTVVGDESGKESLEEGVGNQQTEVNVSDDAQATLIAHEAPSTVANPPRTETEVDIDEGGIARDDGVDKIEANPPDETGAPAPAASPITVQHTPVGEPAGDEMIMETGFTVPGGEIDDSNEKLGKQLEEALTVEAPLQEDATTLGEKEIEQGNEVPSQSVPMSAEAAPPATAPDEPKEQNAQPEAEEEIFQEKCLVGDVPGAKTTPTITTDGQI
ncbi:hypothetical protein ACHAQA_007477 [Verticillium albo-atrum]